MPQVRKSNKLNNVCYDIRGPVLEEAKRLEDEGSRIIKLNIGNPAPFGFDTPEEIMQDMVHNLPYAQGYCDSKGLFAARKAVMHECQRKRIANVGIEDIYIGNGVSELIVMAMQALLNEDDEVLIPAPDYPLWTAAVALSGGNPVHYRCAEDQGWKPDIDNIKAKISPRTKGIVVINPNNPTGAVYDQATLEAIIELARQHNLIVYADEIYDKIVYDGAQAIPMSSLADDVFFVSFNGLSKTYRAAGFRSGWMVLSGSKHRAKDYIQGLDMLASMRLCANVPSMHAIQTALGGYQSINELITGDGRLLRQRNLAWQMLTALPGVSCHKPEGALYLFPRLDPDIYPVENDEKFAFGLLSQQKVLVVQGSGFNLNDNNHFRVVFLPHEEQLIEAVGRIATYLAILRNDPSALSTD
ncbi:MAG: pyridoxal phosphate-dependent aminotransferase [Gammaproteobacteria bacterium]|jgi:alanine-synthesizing transaminase|nr:pyridoxal phosphate-dependent aminotransferase [Gammaproteobacteria bacterium]